MKRLFITFIALTGILCTQAADKMLRISTDNTDLIMHVANDGRVFQTYFGERLNDPAALSYGSKHQEVYQGAGYDDFFEPV